MQSVTEQNNFVLVDRPRPNVALVTLNRPERMNSMAFDVMVPLKAALEELTYDNSVRAVVLTGAGRGFSSGADHKSAGSVPHIDGLTRPDVRAAFDAGPRRRHPRHCARCTSR